MTSLVRHMELCLVYNKTLTLFRKKLQFLLYSSYFLMTAFPFFPGMSATKDLFLSEATHKAFVEVNEEGTEAAAATASFMCGKSLCMCCHRVPTFTANRPFLFFIRHNSSMTLLFAGRFCSPGLQL